MTLPSPPSPTPLPKLSTRSAFPLDENELSKAIAAKVARGEPLLDLTLGNPTAPSAELDLGGDQSLATLTDPRATVYVADAQGLSTARECVVRYLQTIAPTAVPVQADEIFLTASTSEAYSFAFHVLADPGDEILVPAPSYPLLDWLASLAGVVVKRYPLAYDGAWHIDLPALEAALGERTRGVVVVSPNNPTGSYLSTHERAALRSLLAPRGIALLADEVFAEYPLVERGDRVVSVAGEREMLTFAFSGLSKARALPHFKLAWTSITGPGSGLVRDRLALVADTFLSLATPVQVALPKLFEQTKPREAVHDRVRENLAALRARLTARSSAATLLDVEGGWYAVLRLPSFRDEETWTTMLLDRGVLVHPGHFFDFDGGPYVVLSLLPQPRTFGDGIERLLDLVAADSAT
jgi:alanine-synthesizing transaminase